MLRDRSRFDKRPQEMDYRMDEYIHHLDNGISRSQFITLVHFGAPPISGAKEADKVDKTSLYYHDLSKKRP
jgi:hypothetical protein